MSIRGSHAGVEASLSLVESPNLAWPFTCSRKELSDTLSPGSVALKPAQPLFPGVLNSLRGFSQSELGLYYLHPRASSDSLCFTVAALPPSSGQAHLGHRVS